MFRPVLLIFCSIFMIACATSPIKPIAATQTVVGLSLGASPSECAMAWLSFESNMEKDLSLESLPLPVDDAGRDSWIQNRLEAGRKVASPKCSLEIDEFIVLSASTSMLLLRFFRDGKFSSRDRFGGRCNDGIADHIRATQSLLDDCAANDNLGNASLCGTLRSEVNAYAMTYEPATLEPCEFEIPDTAINH